MVHRRVFAFSREDREDVENFRGNGESLADILGESWMSVMTTKQVLLRRTQKLYFAKFCIVPWETFQRSLPIASACYR